MATVLLDPVYAEPVADAGILIEDLQTIKEKGQLAEEYDRKQRADLATKRGAQAGKVKSRKKVDAEDEQFRNRLPVIIPGLSAAPATADLGKWLAQVSFDRYRIKVTSEPPAEGEALGSSSSSEDGMTADVSAPSTEGAAAAETAQPAEVRKLTAATDLHNRYESIAQFIESILEEGREPIVEALSARRLDKARLEKLAKDARELADSMGGKAVLTASDWTTLESDAVKAQKQKWDECRRMIRDVVKATPDTLKEFWSHC
jgi:hypothetical protein